MVTTGTALLHLQALQSWAQMGYDRHGNKPPAIVLTWGDFGCDKNGKPYGPSWFTSKKWQKNMTNRNNRVTFRLARLTSCVVCSAPLPPAGRGDHIIPLALGGPDDSTNYAPICRSCNSRKGIKDLLSWYLSEGHRMTGVPPDLICAYARLTWMHIGEAGLAAGAPAFLLQAVNELAATLPSDAHRAALARIKYLPPSETWDGQDGPQQSPPAPGFRGVNPP